MNDDSVRVNQVWPIWLKDQVRDIVGARGLTDFTIEAVKEKLDRLAQAEHDSSPELQETLSEAAKSPTVTVSRQRPVEAQPADTNSDERPDEVQALSIHALKAQYAQYNVVTAAELPTPAVVRCEHCGTPLIDDEECLGCMF